jgi:hypothetical protein
VYIPNKNIPKIPCGVCGKKFSPRHKKHKYCKRKCFLIYNRKKNIGFPTYICEFCKTSVVLDFSPRHESIKWRSFKCPKCGKTQQQAITQALIVRTSFTTTI